MLTFGKIAFYGTLLTICLSAIPYGTTAPVFKAVLCFLVCIFASFRIVDQLVTERTFRFSGPKIFFPLVGILLLAVLQMFPLPFLSIPISADPYETKIFIISLAAVVIAGETLSHFARTRHSIKALIVTVLIIAAVSSLLGLIRDLFLDERFHIIDRFFSPDTQGYAQFVNRNHFSLLIEMALGLTLGILLKGRPTDIVKFALLVIAGIFVYSAIAANSRGGVISCAVLTASAVFVHFITKRDRTHSRSSRDTVSRPLRGWSKVPVATALCLMTIGASIFTIAFVGGDEMIGRMEKIENEVSENRMNRLAIWQATGQLIADHPAVGVGFGAYASGITKYVARGGGWRMEQAHNEYLEILANGGVIALLLFGLSAVFVFHCALPNFGSRDPLIRSSCFGALVGMLGVLIHSTVDFGLHIMVNSLVCIVLIVIATSNVSPESRAK